MRILLLCILFSFVSQVTKAQDLPDNRFDLRLARDLFLIEKLSNYPSKENYDRLESLGVPTVKDPVLHLFVHVNSFPNAEIMHQLTGLTVKVFPETWLPPIGAHKTGFLLIHINASKVREAANLKFVERLTAAYRQLQPLNDITASETGAQAAWELETPLTGDGIRMVVMDSGFQLDHPDLPEPEEAMDYADWPDTSADVTDLNSGHGTHVAGTVFGSGFLSDGRWGGMAPDAEPIYFKIGNDSTSSASVEAVVGAFRGAATWAEADIATMSYGGYDGFNDGSSPEEQALDWAVSEGVSVFVSAGNSNAKPWNYNGSINAGQTTNPIRLINRMSVEGIPWEMGLTWLDSQDEDVHRSISAEIFDSDGELLFYDEPEWVSSPRGTEARIYLPLQTLPVGPDTIFIEVTNHSDENQDFHIYVSKYWELRFAELHSSYQIGTPATADSCIAVGAYVHRPSYTDFTGEIHAMNFEFGSLAYFSSRGPRIDGVRKPEITAPGKETISCRNTDIIGIDGVYRGRIISNDGELGEPADYLALEGTSMSSPAAAGTAALMLQSNPELNPAELRRWIFDGSRRDEFTGDVPNTHWGWGKIDVINALSADDNPYLKAEVPNNISLIAIYPNPFNSSLNIRFRSDPGLAKISIYDQLGCCVYKDLTFLSKKADHNFSLNRLSKDLPSGNYILNISNDYSSVSARVTLLK